MTDQSNDPSQDADAAADFILETLATALGLETFEPCDGTETWQGDVAGTVYSILRAARVLDDENAVARHPEPEAENVR